VRDSGVQPICNVLPIAPSTYHDHVAKRADPSRLRSFHAGMLLHECAGGDDVGGGG
jgi:hypothetical protein